MKAKIILIIIPVTFLLSFPLAKSQETRNFPFDPFVILKSWNYDFLIKTMGNGEEIFGTSNSQTYLSGLRYPADLIGMSGKLEFTFANDSISRFQFRKEHETRVIDANLADRMARDIEVSKEYNRGIQILDSLRRDSVVRAISEILGPPLSNGSTSVTEKNARHSAFWINRGYSCLYKDYLTYSEIVFALTTVPLWAVREFDIPAGTEILQKTLVNTRKMSWSASLIGFSSDARGMTFSDVFLLLEFSTGQRYLASVPKIPANYLQTLLFLEFATGQRFLISVPNNSISFLPTLLFEDCDGDAIPDAWMQVPSDLKGSQIRHYLFSLQYKEPNLIFNSDDLIPSGINIQNDSRILVTFPDGTTRAVESQGPIAFSGHTVQIKPKGFKYLHSTKLNNDGTTNFIGGIELNLSPETSGIGILEIIYKHSSGGWETDQIKLLPSSK